MTSFLKRARLAAMVGIALLAATATTAHAQPPMNVGPGMSNAQFGAPAGAGRIMNVPTGLGFGGVAGAGRLPWLQSLLSRQSLHARRVDRTSQCH